MDFKIQGWGIKIHSTSVEIFVYFLANGSPSWESYPVSMSVRLIALDKQSGVIPVGVGLIWRRLFPKCVMRVMGPKVTIMGCSDQLRDVLKVGTNGVVHGVQDNWDTK